MWVNRTSSLAKLCSAFEVNKPKDIFPHRFVTPTSLHYVGPVPTFNYFDKISPCKPPKPPIG